MRRFNIIGMAVLFAAAVACGRNKNDNPNAIGTSGTMTPGENAQTTLTGCLRAGSSPGTYVLSVMPADQTKPTGTSGSAGYPTDTNAPRTASDTRIYTVIANNISDASANGGARVSVIGVIDTTAPATGTSGTPTSSTGTTGTSGSAVPGAASSTGGAPVVGTNDAGVPSSTSMGEARIIRASSITKVGEGCQ